MRLHLLGTGSGLLNPQRNASSYLLEAAAGDVLLDCGEPVAATLARRSYDWSRLSGIVITHTHADHLGGLAMLVQQLHLSGRTNPLILHGPSEFVERMHEHLGLFYLLLEAMKFEVNPQPLVADERYQILDLEFTPVPTQHLQPAAGKVAEHGYPNRCEAFALQIHTGERTMFYSGDVSSFDDVRAGLEGAGLALLDSTHVELPEIVQWAAAHPHCRVLLSHVVPGFDEARLAALLGQQGVATVRLAVEGETLDF